jgi:hypothetical protein
MSLASKTKKKGGGGGKTYGTVPSVFVAPLHCCPLAVFEYTAYVPAHASVSPTRGGAGGCTGVGAGVGENEHEGFVCSAMFMLGLL